MDGVDGAASLHSMGNMGKQPFWYYILLNMY